MAVFSSMYMTTLSQLTTLPQHLTLPRYNNDVYHAYYDGNRHRDDNLYASSPYSSDAPPLAHDIFLHPFSHADDPTCQSSGDRRRVHKLDVPHNVSCIYDQTNHHIRESNHAHLIDCHAHHPIDCHAHYDEDQYDE